MTNKDIRDIFFENIKKLFIKDKNFYILTNDADTHSLRSIKNNNRFIDCGVAEQNLINIASGISKSNKISLVFGFCTFLTFRCYEQIKFNIGSMKLNTKIVGLGPGYSFSYDGPTHHAIQDLYLMYLIPEMEVINISDNSLAHEVSKNVKNLKGPVYIRLEKGSLDLKLKNKKYDLKKGYKFINYSPNNKNLLITSGYFCKNALEVSEELKNFNVINFFRFKKFDDKGFYRDCKKYNKIIIYDENSEMGGIKNIIFKNLIDNRILNKIKTLASPDNQLFKYSNSREQIHSLLKIGKKDLKEFILRNI